MAQSFCWKNNLKDAYLNFKKNTNTPDFENVYLFDLHLSVI